MKGSGFGPLARILLVLALVHLPWPGLGPAFCRYFSAVTSPLLNAVATHNVELELGPAPAPPNPTTPAANWTLLVVISTRGVEQRVGAELDVRRVGWLPLGAFSALLVAFPVKRWKRRAFVAGIGFALLHALWVLPVIASFGGAQSGFFVLGSAGYALTIVAQRALQTLPGMAYALPAILWFLLSWRIEPELM
jgi:hypothetical protein